MSRPKNLNLAYNAAQAKLQNYVVALEAENLKLHKALARLEAQNMSQQHRIVAIEDELKKLTKKHGMVVNIHLEEEEKQGEADRAA